jgi:simple sugar transport system ATP-binding protein
MIRDLKEHGKTVILVSHRLEDVLEVSDRIVVFFHGRIRAVVKNEGLQIGDLVDLMFEAKGDEAKGDEAKGDARINEIAQESGKTA